MPSVTYTETRKNLAELLNRVTYRGERIRLKRRGKEVAALVSLEDLELLEQLEDRMDIEAAKVALEESEELIPYEDLRKELGLE